MKKGNNVTTWTDNILAYLQQHVQYISLHRRSSTERETHHVYRISVRHSDPLPRDERGERAPLLPRHQPPERSLACAGGVRWLGLGVGIGMGFRAWVIRIGVRATVRVRVRR